MLLLLMSPCALQASAEAAELRLQMEQQHETDDGGGAAVGAVHMFRVHFCLVWLFSAYAMWLLNQHYKVSEAAGLVAQQLVQ